MTVVCCNCGVRSETEDVSWDCPAKNSGRHVWLHAVPPQVSAAPDPLGLHALRKTVEAGTNFRLGKENDADMRSYVNVGRVYELLPDAPPQWSVCTVDGDTGVRIETQEMFRDQECALRAGWARLLRLRP